MTGQDDFEHMRGKEEETPEQKAKREEEIARSTAEFNAMVKAEQAFWAKVPSAGSDPKTGIEAQYMVDEKRTPKGNLIYKGGYHYRLGEGITVDGKPYKGQLMRNEGQGCFYSLGGGIEVDGKSLTKVVPYTTSRDIDTGEAVCKVFPPNGERYTQRQRWSVSSRVDQIGAIRSLIGMNIVFTDEGICIREYTPTGRGDSVYVLDNDSGKRIDVTGHTFYWFSSGQDARVGEVHRYTDNDTGIDLIFTTLTPIEEFAGTTITTKSIKEII